MKKINTTTMFLGKSASILTTTQMSAIKGGTSTASDVLSDLDLPTDNAVCGPLSATDDDKRRDRPGGGVSTH